MICMDVCGCVAFPIPNPKKKQQIYSYTPPPQKNYDNMSRAFSPGRVAFGSTAVIRPYWSNDINSLKLVGRVVPLT